MKELILEVLNNKFSKYNGFVYSVTEHKNGFTGGQYLKIWIACSDVNINNVAGQKVQAVSLCLELNTMDLYPQIYGGMGGQCIYRLPNLNDPSEKFLAMKSVKIPFRKPKPEEKNILDAVSKFCDNYIKALEINIDVLMYQNLVDYKTLLGK